jgi:hypothetical protein
LAKVSRNIGVSIEPGQTQLTRIFSVAWLIAMLLVIVTMAPFDAL